MMGEYAEMVIEHTIYKPALTGAQEMELQQSAAWNCPVIRVSLEGLEGLEGLVDEPVNEN
jgi:hypothetical protein